MRIEAGFQDGKILPVKYANFGVEGGQNISVPLNWSDAPEHTKSFTVAMVDHHPVANEFVHWIVINIASDVYKIEEGASLTYKMPLGSKELNTTYNKPGYGGPRPPAGSGSHPYEITVYALSETKLVLSDNLSPNEVISLLDEKRIDKASITALFEQ